MIMIKPIIVLSNYVLLNMITGMRTYASKHPNSIIPTQFQGASEMVTLNSKRGITADVNLVIWRGFGIKPRDYTEFGRILQSYGKMKNLDVNVYIPKYNIIPQECSKRTILFGHSTGGDECIRYTDIQNKLLAKISYGATAVHNNSSLNSTLDTLCLFGEKDDFVKDIHRQQSSFQRDNMRYVCVRGATHMCIVKNTVYELFNINRDRKRFQNTVHIGMMNRIASITIDYIMYLTHNEKFFERYISDTISMLQRPVIQNVSSMIDFLRDIPDTSCKDTIYVHNSNEFVYIKCYKYTIKNYFIEHKRYESVVELILSHNDNVISYVCVNNILYIKIPSVIFYHNSVRNIDMFWYDYYLYNHNKKNLLV